MQQLLKKLFFEILGNRYLVLVSLAYIAGIILSRSFMAGTFYFYLLSLLFLLLLAMLYYCGLISFFRVSLLLFIAFTGAVSFYYSVLPPENGILKFAGTPLYIEGTVVEEPLVEQAYQSYQLQAEIVETREGRQKTGGLLLVKIYGADNTIYQFGERLRLRAVIIEPKGLRNPGGFDYRFFLRSQGIEALAYPNALQVDQLGAGKINPLAGSAIALRQQMVAFIDATLPLPASDLVTAILFGQRKQLPAKVEDNFRRAGAGHLMAVSGLHVGLVAAMILGLFSRLRLKGHVPLILAIILVFGYAYLTGMRPSALRAAIMTSMVLGAMLLERENDLPTAVAFAALATLFVNPLLLFAVGFQLSYAATLAIIYLYRPLSHFLIALRLPQLICAPLAVTMAAQIGVLPLSVYYFHHLPTGALIFNLLFLPLIAFVIGLGIAGALLGLIIPLAGEYLLWASRPILELMLYISGFSALPGFYLALAPPRIITLIVIYLFMCGFLFSFYSWEKCAAAGKASSYAAYLREMAGALMQKKPKKVKTAVFLALLAAVIYVWTGIFNPGLKDLIITFIDVGQGSAALVEMPCGVNLLIDAGGEPAYSVDPGATGEKVVFPYLQHRGIKKVDLAVITHPHEDHFGGYLYLAGRLPISWFLISPVIGDSPHYLNLLSMAKKEQIPVVTGTAGESWHCCCPELKIDILNPPAGLIRGSGSELNNNSLVLLLQYREVKVLFTGDIEDPAVVDLLSRYPGLRADLLQIPHHGGYLPSIDLLLETVQPELALIQVGINTFGHPHPQITGALKERGIITYRSDQDGAVVFRTNGLEYEVKTTVMPAWAR